MWNVWQCWAILLVTLVTVLFLHCLKKKINHIDGFIFNLNCLNNPARSVRILECVCSLACIIICQFSPDLLPIFPGCPSSLIQKWGYFCLILTLNVQLVILVNSLLDSLQSSLLFISQCWWAGGWGGGGGRQLAKHCEKVRKQGSRKSVVEKERANGNRKSFLNVDKLCYSWSAKLLC